MPLGKYLERRDFQLIVAVGFLVALLMMRQYGVFLAYGVPGITVHEAVQTKPVAKTVSILGSYGDWIAYEYYQEARASWKSLLLERYVIVGLDVKIGVKIEVTDLALGDFLTEIKPPPFLINETEDSIVYKNITIHAYSYGFVVKIGWTGTAHVTVREKGESPGIPYWATSYEDLTKECVKNLVADFNRYAYIAANPILMTVDAPTLASDKAYTLKPDYLGIAGMWLANYNTKGQTYGTGVEASPSSPGTAVKLYRDKELTLPCWAPDYDALGKPLLTPSDVYWLQNLAPQSAWWKTTLINLGCELVYDESKANPDYISWAWEKYSDSFPQLAQVFRIDILFRVTKDWVVPNIPQYQMEPEMKEKMKIIYKQEPDLVSPPVTPPPVTPAFPLREIIYVMLLFFGGLTAVIIVYYVSKGKFGVKKT